MNRFVPCVLCLTQMTQIVMYASASSTDGIWIDDQNDATVRRTDLGNNALLPEGFLPIDLLSVSVQGWFPANALNDLYTGFVVLGEADFVRIQIVVDGLVSPPGPVGLNGFPYNPYQFGDRPIVGYIDVDIDADKDSGGELMPLASNRYLSNIGRFGLSPKGSIADRMAQSAMDIDFDFFSDPEIERSGAEFTLSLCGCFTPMILTESGNMNSLFDFGETWVVEGRFFERFESFQSESGLFGGPEFGLFNPMTTLQFAHDPNEDQTTITLVFPITNAGAALMVNEPQQSLDSDISNHTSIEEALDDLIYGADYANGPLGVLTEDWQDENYADYRIPSLWNITALIGTAPILPHPSSLYIWTDTGFDELYADFNLDKINDTADDEVLQKYIDDNDGGPNDADLVINGSIQIPVFGLNFHFFDLNYDGQINSDDLPNPVCIVDFLPDGVLNFSDLSIFITLYTNQDDLADLDSDGFFNFSDIAEFLILYAQGCP